MIATLMLAALAAVGPSDARCLSPADAAPSGLRDLYASGQTFEAFLDGAQRRRRSWLANYARSAVPPELLGRATAVAGVWRLLVVAVDSCSDSVSTIPYVARLVEQVEGLDMRIVDSGVGRAVMEAHPTPDGRASTPTLVLLDEGWAEAGCFIERPLPLRTWLEDNRTGASRDELYEGKMAWYDEDQGLSTVRQIVEMMEAAATGEPVCR